MWLKLIGGLFAGVSKKHDNVIVEKRNYLPIIVIPLITIGLIYILKK